jgi:hypothetical protein
MWRVFLAQTPTSIAFIEQSLRQFKKALHAP